MARPVKKADQSSTINVPLLARLAAILSRLPWHHSQRRLGSRYEPCRSGPHAGSTSASRNTARPSGGGVVLVARRRPGPDDSSGGGRGARLPPADPTADHPVGDRTASNPARTASASSSAEADAACHSVCAPHFHSGNGAAALGADPRAPGVAPGRASTCPSERAAPPASDRAPPPPSTDAGPNTGRRRTRFARPLACLADPSAQKGRG